MKKIDKKNIEDIFALTPMQEGMLFHYLKDPEGNQYFEQLSLNISGNIDITIFKKTWNFVIETNEMLRTVFRWENVKNPIQIVLKQQNLNFEYHDISNKHNNEKQKLLEEIKSNDRKRKFDLHEVPFRITLCKIEIDRYEIIISNHHILYDGWSNGIILKEFFKVYENIITKKSIRKTKKNKFKEFVRLVNNDDKEKQRRYWKRYLNGFDTRTELAFKKKNKSEKIIDGKNEVILKNDLKINMDEFVKKYKLSISLILYCAWGILLQKYNDSDDVVFGTTVSGRSVKLKGIEEMIGLFINSLPLRINTNPDEKIINLLNRINRFLKDRQEFESSSLVNIKEYCELDNRVELFDSLVIIENYPLDRMFIKNNKLTVKSYSMFELTNYDLSVGVMIFNDIKIIFNYNKTLFDEESINKISDHFIRIIKEIILCTGKKVSDIEIIKREEKQKILYEFNNTATLYPKDKTIQELFEEQVEKTPNKVAVVFQDKMLTYNELYIKANQLALVLRDRGVKPDSMVGIMVDRSIEMMVGILGILKSGGAYLPIDAEYPEERIRYMLRDSSAELLLTERKYIDHLGELFPTLLVDDDGIYINIDKSHKNVENINTSRDLAYIMYTSGSMGIPKSVMVEHMSINRLVLHSNYVELSKDTRILQTGAPVFDATTFEIWGSLLNGGQLFLIRKEEILDAHQLALLLVKNDINTLWLSAPLFNQLFDENKETFSPLKYLVVGGDILSPWHINQVRRTNQELKVVNGYGPTENTTFSVCHLIEREYTDQVPIGRPISNSSAYIYDKGKQLVPIGVIGELYVGGDGVSRGYLNNLELTSESFIDNPNVSGGRLYCTGDLARWQPDGNIEFLGRIDNQVKIRGFRIEPGEIELNLLRYKAIKKAIVTINEDHSGAKFLCAYFVADVKLGTHELKNFLAKVLPDYMIPAFFIQIEKIPLTLSGKIDYIFLKSLPIEKNNNFTLPENDLEVKLLNIWYDVLNVPEISVTDNFFEIGGHSLNAMSIMLKIQKKFNISLNLEDIFRLSTIRKLSELLQKSQKYKFKQINNSEKKEFYPLSSAQKRIYILQQMQPNTCGYNLPSIFILEGRLDYSQLIDTFKILIERHESLRTSFQLYNEAPIQRIHSDISFNIEINSLDTKLDNHLLNQDRFKINNLINNYIQPFTLSKAPLLRVVILKNNDREHIFFIDMHHIITDGISIEILLNEFKKLYSNSELDPIRIQNKDYAIWQNERLHSIEMKKMREYWLNQCKGEIPKMNLPLDYSRISIKDYEGNSEFFEINKNHIEALKRLALKEKVTDFMLFLALYFVLLSKICNQTDIIVGVPVGGRRHVDLDFVVGMFVNTLAIRCFPREETTFIQFLKDVKSIVLAAIENQEYQFEDLIEALNISREPERNPLFDVAFDLQNFGIKPLEVDDYLDNNLKMKKFDFPDSSSHFDLSLVLYKYKDIIRCSFEYRTKMFKRVTILRFIDYFKKIVLVVAENNEIELKDINLLESIEDISNNFFSDNNSDFIF